MSTYLDYLNQISSKKTFSRKIDYIRYNFSSYILSKKKSDKFLEVGPGLGHSIKFFNSKGFKIIDIIDNDDSILNYISNKFEINNIYKTDDIKEIENQLDHYDVILATQVLEHVPINQYQYFLKILYKHLNKDGYLIITVPNMANPFTIFERYGDITHTNGFTDNSLIELALMSEIPRSSIKIRAYKIPPYSLLNIIRIFFQKILHLTLLFLSIINGGGYSKLLTPNITLLIKK